MAARRRNARPDGTVRSGPSKPLGKSLSVFAQSRCRAAPVPLGRDTQGTRIQRSPARAHAAKPGSPQTVCPYSGFVAEDGDFVHFDDVEAVKKQILWEAEADLHDYLADFAKDFNRGMPRGGFISMSMKFEGRQSPRPLAIREDLLRDLECDACARAYAVYAIALFCPDCGASNLALHYRRETELIREQVALASQMDQAGRAELAYRLMGNAHEDVLTAFETAMKTVYRHLVRQRMPDQAAELSGKKEIGNGFQNIERGRGKFAAFRIDPFAALGKDEIELLRLNIQKRHVIGHNLGIADEYYAELTQGEQPGETVNLSAMRSRASPKSASRSSRTSNLLSVRSYLYRKNPNHERSSQTVDRPARLAVFLPPPDRSMRHLQGYRGRRRKARTGSPPAQAP